MLRDGQESFAERVIKTFMLMIAATLLHRKILSMRSSPGNGPLMSNPNEMFDRWLNAKDNTNKYLLRIISANKSNDAANALDEYSAKQQYFIDVTRKIFDRDEKRIKVRDATIRYLQDKLAAKE